MDSKEDGVGWGGGGGGGGADPQVNLREVDTLIVIETPFRPTTVPQEGEGTDFYSERVNTPLI